MNPVWKKLVTKIVLNKKENDYSDFRLAKGLRELRITTFAVTKDVVLILMGVACATFGFKGFLLTNHFIDGGATGISLLISALTPLPLSLLIIVVNIPFVFLGYKTLGKTFTLKTIFAISALAVCLALLQFPDVTNDNLLVAVFGGFFLGAGIGLTVRGGAVIDGTEVLAIFLSKKFGTTIGDIIIMINVIIFSAAAFFLSVEIALYSMLTYLAASKTLDFIVDGIEEYTGVTIISSHNEEVRSMIINKMGRGVTVYSGKRGFGKQGEAKEIDIIYTVITRLELNKLNIEIQKIDSNAFVVMSSVKDTKGGMIKKRALKH